ncbi:MAG: acyl-CoA synthetase [Syntrophobacteraceae bacterium]
MGKIPKNYLPPKDTWPEYIVPEEFADTPMQVNLADFLLDRHVREGRGGNAAVRFMDGTYTYAQLQQMVNRFGNSLRSIGVESQDRIGFRLANTLQAITAIFAIEKIGAIPVPIPPLWSQEEVAFVANNAEMKYLIVNGPLMEPVEEAKTDFRFGTKVIVIGGNPSTVRSNNNLVFEELMEKGSSELAAVMLDAHDIGVILYTSGTTGPPKGCVHFVRPTLIEARLVNKYVYKMKPGDVLGGAAPVSFAAGFGTYTLMPFVSGAAISLIPKLIPSEMMAVVAKHGITVLSGLPAGYRTMMKFINFKNHDISSIRLFTSGGDILGAQTLNEWQEMTGHLIWEGLGCTEMLHLLTSNTMNNDPMPDSIGKPLPGIHVRVVDFAGKDCKPGEVGSMLVKGPSGTLYWKPYEDNERLLKSQRRGVVDGWNKTGDAVFMKEDGNIFFVSREDDMIKSSGYRIGPAEVESAISRHPAVEDVGVVGIPDPDKGQITKAVIVLRSGINAKDKFTEELKQFLKKYIAVYKLPRVFAYVESLPRTPTGKLIRNKLR